MCIRDRLTCTSFLAKLIIPNALLILLFPLYTFCNQFDILTVCTADYGILSDLYLIGNKCTGYDCTFSPVSYTHLTRA